MNRSTCMRTHTKLNPSHPLLVSHRRAATRGKNKASVLTRGLVAVLLIALPIALASCTCQNNTPTEKTADSVAQVDAEPTSPDASAPTTARAAAASSNAEADGGRESEKMNEAREPRTEEELRGAWLLDRQATIEQMSLIQQKSVGAIVEEMTVALTFGPDGTLAVRGVAMGIAQEHGGHYEVLDIANQVLRVRIFREPVRGDDDEVIQPGSTLNMHVEFLDDDTIRWAPDNGQDDVEKPGEIRTLILVRDQGDLEERFKRALEYDGSALED